MNADKVTIQDNKSAHVSLKWHYRGNAQCVVAVCRLQLGINNSTTQRFSLEALFEGQLRDTLLSRDNSLENIFSQYRFLREGQEGGRRGG